MSLIPQVKIIKNIKKIVIASNSGAHNAIYRGNDITNLFYNGTLTKQISAGTFDDIFIGDYIIGKQSSRKYLVADIDYRLHTGDVECTKHHILMIPEKIMGNEQMNDSNITTGAYIESKMYTQSLSKYKTIIKNDFETGHILSHKNFFAKAVEAEYESSSDWYDSDIDLMNEIMVCGSNIFHNVGNGTKIPSNQTIDNSQLALFRLKSDSIIAFDDSSTRKSYWLRDVSASYGFSYIHETGVINIGTSTSSHGIRPAFLIY